MTIEDKILKRTLLLADIRKKKKKLKQISAIYNRNCYEYCQMVKEHDKLDREIFEAKPGITKIESYKSGKQMQTNQQILSDAFIDSLNDETKRKLLARLQNRVEQTKINQMNQSLKEV